jgi:hypothetical protein
MRIPCPDCGSKGNFHFLKCPRYKDNVKKGRTSKVKKVEDQTNVALPSIEVVPPGPLRQCPNCGVQLLRASCGNGATLCIHGMPLDMDCSYCTQMHHGNVTWRCPQCGMNTGGRSGETIMNTMPRVDGVFGLPEVEQVRNET